MKSAIPHELKSVVSQAVKLLGIAIQDIYGSNIYEKVETLRLRMKEVRNQEASVVENSLNDVYFLYKDLPTEDLSKIAKSFSLMLELINCCEASYRTFRLKEYNIAEGLRPHSLIFVFTGHPTEARSKNFLLLMDKIEKILNQGFSQGFEAIRDQLFYMLRISLRLNLANNRRPKVKDEVEEIFHTVLAPAVLKEQVFLKKRGINVLFRTWAGGDKDGHPKVGPASMLQSWTISRKKIVDYIQGELNVFLAEVSVVEPSFIRLVRGLIREANSLKKILAGDGRKVSAFKKSLMSLIKKAESKKIETSTLKDLVEIVWLYPALVLPLEVREDHELIHRALKDRHEPIALMLNLLKKVSRGFEAKWYVRGFVISMCQSSTDMLAAIKLTKKEMGDIAIPVIPLFENEHGLINSIKILEESFQMMDFKSLHAKKFGNRFEVMLGYSDSSKENGVFPGRLLVERALLGLDSYLLGKGFIPVFFHGSGGSVSRGGGSIKEQIAWWPQTALNTYKVTVQGETVQRHFHNPLIMRSQVGKIVEEYANYEPKKVAKNQSLDVFAKEIQNQYRALVSDEDFQDVVTKSTPYDFLNLLKIGSRPTKRSGKGSFTIRAIPWILCWTQTRLLLPFWWGIGASWKLLNMKEKEELKKYYKKSALMQSYVKNLGFTLAKIELGVWNFHMEHSSLSLEKKKKWRDLIQNELELSIRFFYEISGEKDYTWFRPMLGESIVFRSSMIHPLNVIQKISLERRDDVLLRETVTGIASGMLTTG